MAGPVTPAQAECIWNKYKKDGSAELTVGVVKQCLQEIYGSVADSDEYEKIIYLGQKAKTLTKEEIMQGIRNTSYFNLKEFDAMDKDNNGFLSKEELEPRLAAHDFEGEQQAKFILDRLKYKYDGTHRRNFGKIARNGGF